MNLRSLFAVAAVAAASLPAHAVTVAAWNFEAYTAPTAASTTLTGVASSEGAGVASAFHATASTYSTPAGNGSAKSLSSNTWAVGDYYQFAFSTTGLTGLSISFDQNGSGTGPRDFTFAYSTNGTTFSNFANYSLPAGVTWNATTASAATSFTMDLSSVATLANASSVYVRLIDASTTSIAGATVGAGGTDRVDNFTVTAVAAVPEPETYAMLFAGLGVVGFIARRRKN